MKRVRDRNAVIDEYAKLASEYDVRWSSYVRATTDATLARLPQSPGDVLDVGCGTGALLERLSANYPGSHLAGVDASAQMLSVARTRLPATIALKHSWAEELPYDDCSFDTVISCNMFHFISQPEAALAEMMRVLRPNGKIVITDWCDDFISCKLCVYYLRWFERSHSVIYGSSQCYEMLKAANGCRITIDKYKVTWIWGMMTATSHKPDSPNVSR